MKEHQQSLSTRDAFVVLAIRLMGGDVRNNPSARQHIVALSRANPFFRDEAYAASEDRVLRFASWAGSTAMDGLFARSLDLLRRKRSQEALQWAADNAVAQQQTDEMNAMLHHVGKGLGFTPSEVEDALGRALRHSAGGPTRSA